MSVLLTLEPQSSRERDSATKNTIQSVVTSTFGVVGPPSECFRSFTGLHSTPHCSTVQNKSVSANMAMVTSLPKTVETKWTAEKTLPSECAAPLLPVLPTRTEAAWIFLRFWAYGATCLTRATWGPTLALCISWPLGSGAVNRWYTTLWRHFGSLYGGGSCECDKD